MNLLQRGAGWLLTVVGLGLAGPALADDPNPVATNLWSIRLSRFVCHSSAALAPDGTIYQATFEGQLIALTPEGRRIWQFAIEPETEIKSSPAIADDGTIYFGARNGKFYAVTPAGRLKWVFPTGAWVDSSPAIMADGTICFGGWDQTFYALTPAGALKWNFAVGAIVVSSPAIAADGTIYFGAFDKCLYALTPDGKLKWRFATGEAINSSPAIGADGTVYFNSTDGNVYAVAPNGAERWHVHCGSYTEASPILDEAGNVIVAGNPDELHHEQFLVSPAGKWRTLSGLACPVEEAALAVTGGIYWSRPWRSLQAGQADAHELWYAATRENLTTSPVENADGIVYFMGEGNFYAVRPVGTPLPPAKSSWPMYRANPRHTGRVGS